MHQNKLKPEDTGNVLPDGTWQPKLWPQPGDRILHEASGREGDVLSNDNGVVRVDWGLYITTVRASELVFVC